MWILICMKNLMLDKVVYRGKDKKFYANIREIGGLWIIKRKCVQK